MNRRQLLLILVLAVVIGGLGLYFKHRQAASWEQSSQTMGHLLMADLPVNNIDHITVQQGQSRVDLVKKNERWTVQQRDNYPANFSQISDFVRKIAQIKVTQTVDAEADELNRFHLLPPDHSTNSATLVVFHGAKDKPLGVLMLGKEHYEQTGPTGFGGGSHGFPDGRYVMALPKPPTKPLQGSQHIALISDSLSDIQPKPQQWLDKDFFKVQKLKSVSVTFPNPTNSWTLTRDTESGPMKLAHPQSGEELDSSKASGVSSALSYPSFDDILTNAQQAAAAVFDNAIDAKLTTFDNFTYNIKIGKETANQDYPIQVNVSADIPKHRTPGKSEKPDEKKRLDKQFQDRVKKLQTKLDQEQKLEHWTYLVSKWTVSPLLKKRSELVKPPKTAKAAKKSSEPRTPPKATSPALLPPTPPATSGSAAPPPAKVTSPVPLPSASTNKTSPPLPAVTAPKPASSPAKSTNSP